MTFINSNQYKVSIGLYVNYKFQRLNMLCSLDVLDLKLLIHDKLKLRTA